MVEVAVHRLSDEEDIDRWVEVRNSVDPQLPVTVEGVRRWREHERTVEHVLGYLGGEPVGAAFCQEQGDLRHTDVAGAFFGVVAARRGHGVGSALYATVSEHARRLAKRKLQVDLWEDEDDGLRFLGRRRFAEVERFARVRLELNEARLLDRPPPPGIEIVPLEGCLELAPALFEVAREAAADMPSTDPIDFSYDDWYGWEIRRETLRHDLGQVALADGEPVGFGTITVAAGSREGWNSITAVRRAWRRRGVATAIKRAQIEAATVAGISSLTAFSERRNVGMRALNEQLGYRPLPDQVRMRGPLV